MKKNIFFIFLYFTFWFLFFEIGRLLFICFNYSKLVDAGFIEISASFYHGLFLDLSIGGYFTILPILLISVFGATKHEKFVYKIIQIYTLFLLVINGFLIFLDAKLYQFWEIKLSAEPIKYIDTSGDSLSAIRVSDFLIPIASCVVLVSGFLFFYKWLINKISLVKSNYSILNSILTFVIGGLVFLPIRGGIDLYPEIRLGSPISTSAAYYSAFPACNHASLNPIWYSIYTFTLGSKELKVEKFYDDLQVKTWTKELTIQKGETNYVLNSKQPNVVFIIVESLSANVFGPLGGNPACTPRLNEWSKKGLLFSNFYASSCRSDRGLSALITGVPSLPRNCVMEYPNRYAELPFIYKSLKSKDYTSSFFYGGDLNFVNFKSFFTDAKVDNIVGRNDYPTAEWKSKWGVPDDKMLDYFYEHVDKSKCPSFNSIFTLSSHHPYDIPAKYKFEGDNDDARYSSSIYFTDSCLGRFLDKASTQKWWDNTLVIIVADHSVGQLSNTAPNMPNRFHIPMIWTGGALKNEYRGTVNSTIGSQVDLAKTLCTQLDIDASQYVWGKNILSKKAANYAFYSNGDFVGFVGDSTLCLYNYERKEVEDSTGVHKYPFNPAKAYLQEVADYFFR